MKEDEQDRANVAYFNSDYEDLRHLYKDQWVAVYNGKVVGHDKDYDCLSRRLHRMEARKEIRVDLTYIQRTYFREEPDTAILANYNNQNVA